MRYAGTLAEYGWVTPKGAARLVMLADLLDDGEKIGETSPEAARPMSAMMVDMLTDLDERIAALDKEITQQACDTCKERRFNALAEWQILVS